MIQKSSFPAKKEGVRMDGDENRPENHHARGNFNKNKKKQFHF